MSGVLGGAGTDDWFWAGCGTFAGSSIPLFFVLRLLILSLNVDALRARCCRNTAAGDEV